MNLKKLNKIHFFEVREDDMQILFKGVALTLTLAEYDILKLLIQRNHGVVAREDFIYARTILKMNLHLKILM